MNSEHEPTLPTSITVIKFENESIERSFIEDIEASYAQLYTLLPTLPRNLKVSFGTNYNYGDDGVTGSAVGSDAIQVGINHEVENRTNQHTKIHSLIFHEGFHIAQGFHLGSQFSALESAIYEGSAAIFEREYAGSTPKWGDYSKEDAATLQRWLNGIKDITAEQYFEPSGDTWRKWAFYDPETKESWRVYKVGTWLVENILKLNNVDIIDLNTKTAEEIMRLNSDFLKK